MNSGKWIFIQRAVAYLWGGNPNIPGSNHARAKNKKLTLYLQRYFRNLSKTKGTIHTSVCL